MILTAVLCFQLWPHRKLLQSKILLINMSFYFIWSFWVVLTLLTDDHDLRIIFTKVRQVTNPFITTTWVMMACVLFYKPIWVRYKKWLSILYVLPVITSVASLLSIFKVNGVEPLLAQNFQEIPSGAGLLAYQTGPLLKVQFLYGSILIFILYSCYVLNLFSKNKRNRQYALFLSLGGVAPVFLEWGGRYYLDNTLLVQMNAGMSWTLVLFVYYGVTRIEFLNIKAFAQQRVFENLPNPVLTLTPRMEIWDANLAAKELFSIEDENIGMEVLSDERFDFVASCPDKVNRLGKTYQLLKHEIPLRGTGEQGTVLVLSDVTEINELNAEMEAHNKVLKDLNTEIWRITSFNRKVQTILSHDMTGVLGSIHSLARAGGDSHPHMQKILQANASSMDLLKNILSWSHEEENIDLVEVSRSVDKALSQLSSQILDKNINVNNISCQKNLFIRGSSNMVETILRNVLSNAIKFSSREGVVFVSLAEVDNHVEIKISDFGRGMSPEDIESIMTNKPIKSERSEGYGVGLRFTLEFVEQLMGRLRIESELGKGTVVALHFPLYKT